MIDSTFNCIIDLLTCGLGVVVSTWGAEAWRGLTNLLRGGDDLHLRVDGSAVLD